MANETKAIAQQSARGEGFSGEATIEIVEERNRMVMWPPEQKMLRSRWSRSNLTGDEMVEAIGTLMEIPGVRIQADGRVRRLRIWDPLTEENNAGLLKEISRIMKEQFRSEVGPGRQTLIDEATDVQIRTWLYWMRRLVDGRPLDEAEIEGKRRPTMIVNGKVPQAVVVSGTLPTIEEIRRSGGDVRVGFFDSSVRGIKTLEQMEKLNR
jgi:hypothetical protein